MLLFVITSKRGLSREMIHSHPGAETLRARIAQRERKNQPVGNVGVDMLSTSNVVEDFFRESRNGVLWRASSTAAVGCLLYRLSMREGAEC